MKTSKLLYGAGFLFVAAMGVAAYALQLDQGLVVRIPSEVTINEKRLPAGEYEIRKLSNVNTVFQFYNRDELRYETHALPIPTENNTVVEDSKVVLQKVGDDYYLTKIWLGGTKTGYELPLPERARSLQRELEQSIPGEARVGTPLASNKGSAPISPAPSSTDTRTSENRADTTPQPVAAQPESPAPQVAQNVPQQQPPVDARPPAVSPSPAQQPAPEAQQPAAQQPENVQDAQPSTLPATASGWSMYLLIGVSLLVLAAVVRRV